MNDVLTCFLDVESAIDGILEYLNNPHKTINFTIEKEVNNSINHLDLNIMKCQKNHKFIIFRKFVH